MVLDSMNLEFSDLFAEAKTNGQREVIAEYDYTDEFGRLLYQVVRFHPKDFRQRRPDKHGGWIWNMQGVERVPYMLHEILATDEPIFIVEGEKDVHTLRVKGFVATTNSGGAMKWQPEWTPYFEGRRVYIVPDMDEAGLAHANYIAATLKSVAEVRVIQVWGAKDVTEWLLHNPADEFQKLIENAEPWVEELTLPKEPEFQFSSAPIYEGLAGEFVKLVEPSSEADPLALFMEFTAMFGSCLGAGPHYLVTHTKHRGNLFIVLVGSTGVARKGTGHDSVEEFFRLVDVHYVEKCIQRGLASGEGMVHAVRDPITRQNKKGEIIVDDPGVTDKRALFFESELAGRTFTAMKREGSTLSAVLRQAWETTTLSVLTKKLSERATDAHITVVGHATAQELLGTLRDSDITGGFANRFMFFMVRRSKVLPRPEPPDLRDFHNLVSRTRQALDAARRRARVHLAEDAYEIWDKIYVELTAEGDKDEPERQMFLARGAPQILRLALIFALMDCQPEIGRQHLLQAKGIWDYSHRSVEYMLALGGGNLGPRTQALYEYLETVVRPVTRAEIKAKMKWSGATTSNEVGELLRRNIAIEVKEKVNGRMARLVTLR